MRKRIFREQVTDFTIMLGVALIWVGMCMVAIFIVISEPAYAGWAIFVAGWAFMALGLAFNVWSNR